MAGVVLGQGGGLQVRTQVVVPCWALDVTPCPLLLGPDLVIQAQAYSLEWSPLCCGGVASTVWTHALSVCLSDMKILSYRVKQLCGCNPGSSTGFSAAGRGGEHQVRRVTAGSSKWVSVPKLLARWMLGMWSECCLLLLSYQYSNDWDYWELGPGLLLLCISSFLIFISNTMRGFWRPKGNVTGSEDLCFFVLTLELPFKKHGWFMSMYTKPLQYCKVLLQLK